MSDRDRDAVIDQMVETLGYNFNSCQPMSVLSLVSHQYNEYLVDRCIEHLYDHKKEISITLARASVKSKLDYLEREGFTFEKPFLADNVRLIVDIRNYYAHHMINPLQEAPPHLKKKDLNEEMVIGYDTISLEEVCSEPLDLCWMPILNLIVMGDNDRNHPQEIVGFVSKLRYVAPDSEDFICVDLEDGKENKDTTIMTQGEIESRIGGSVKDRFYGSATSTIIGLMNTLIRLCPEFPY